MPPVTDYNMKYSPKLIKKGLDSIKKRLDLENLSESLYFPKYFEIETIRACNARCVMCTVYKWKNKNNLMSEKLFNKFVNEIKNYGEWINRVCLSRNGEPLLDKTLVEKIYRLKDCGIKYTTFSTNASLLNKKKSIELIKSGLDDIRLSIDGATKKTFEAIRKGLNYEQVVENCLRFIDLRNESGIKPTVQVRMVLQKENEDEKEKFKEFWLSKISKQDIVSSKPMHNWGNQLQTYEKSDELEKYSYVPCISPWSTMIVHFDGKVPLCGCDYNNKIILGDLNNQTMKEIWQSKEFYKIREKHASGKRNDIILCRGCNIWDVDIKKIYRGND